MRSMTLLIPLSFTHSLFFLLAVFPFLSTSIPLLFPSRSNSVYAFFYPTYNCCYNCPLYYPFQESDVYFMSTARGRPLGTDSRLPVHLRSPKPDPSPGGRCLRE